MQVEILILASNSRLWFGFYRGDAVTASTQLFMTVVWFLWGRRSNCVASCFHIYIYSCRSDEEGRGRVMQRVWEEEKEPLGHLGIIKFNISKFRLEAFLPENTL
jgi:hypothetical protein